MEQLVDVTRELDAVIYQLQAAGPRRSRRSEADQFPVTSHALGVVRGWTPVDQYDIQRESGVARPS